MIEGELRKYIRDAGPVDEDYKFEMGTIVSKGLCMEKGIGETSTPEVRQEIIDQIAETIYIATRYLGLYPFPRITVTCQWGVTPPSSQLNSEGTQLASASLGGKFPVGVIRFAPIYLEGISDYMMGRRKNSRARDYWNRHQIIDVTAHEVFHLSQFEYDQGQIDADAQILADYGFDEWNKTLSEKDAKAFGTAYLLASRPKIE